MISSPKEALHQVNQEVSLGRLDDSRPTAHCDGQIFKQRIRMDGCLSKVGIIYSSQYSLILSECRNIIKLLFKLITEANNGE